MSSPSPISRWSPIQLERLLPFPPFAMSSINRAVGSEIRRLPISHRATVSCRTPSAAASWTWVIFKRARIRFSCSGVTSRIMTNGHTRVKSVHALV